MFQFQFHSDKKSIIKTSTETGTSTETALLSVIEALRLARAASKSSFLISLDLPAVFDNS